jgi:site-specific recombinase XerD
VSEDSLLERVTTAAEERHLSQNTLIAYRRTWLKLLAWSAAERPVLETLPTDSAGEFYHEATNGRSASHHLQVKAALALLYDVLGTTNLFAKCEAPKFARKNIELRYHTASQLGRLLRELREDRRSYFGHLTYHLAIALFFTGCRFHEWARLTTDRLVRARSGIVARLRVKGGYFRDLPLTKELSDSLEDGSHSWKVSGACGFGVGE